MTTNTLTTPNTPATITTNHTPVTPPCGLNPNQICREESDTPHMGELTAFRSIASIPNLLPMEFARALHKATGRPMFPRKDPVFGVGAGFASGDP